ncbi:MotA/TolQ/ExbB proton channel family protein [Undibacterium danionis]|uniref:Biopolymer transport protein ExbB n=1 Tax=Undibacterium danionis TaxID=1812100 RepID=A0ABV6ICC5_9BURK
MPITITQYLMQLDTLGRAVALLLILMSLVSWFTIFSKAWSFWRIRRGTSALHFFWQAPTMQDAVNSLAVSDVENIYTPLAKQGLAASDPQVRARSMMANTDAADVMTRVLREELTSVTVRLESGLTLLASIGATAPFVGLLGTVWGIYHALTAVSGSSAIQIDLVAGPVGEALVMTGLGLMVAIPAVLAYNAFNRINRITFAELDGFAFDLHAYFTKLS